MPCRKQSEIIFLLSALIPAAQMPSRRSCWGNAADGPDNKEHFRCRKESSMPPELLLDYIERCKDGRKLSFMILFHCAPVLKGVKASNMITAKKIGRASCRERVCAYV